MYKIGKGFFCDSVTFFGYFSENTTDHYNHFLCAVFREFLKISIFFFPSNSSNTREFEL